MQYLLTGSRVGAQHPNITYTAILPDAACIIALFMVVSFRGFVCQDLIRKNVTECRCNGSLVKY